jgi:predicted RNA-binding protein with PIN domain
MYIIIDGYNILKGLYDGAYIDERQRSLFITRLASYAKKKGHAMALVFDGGDFSYAVKESVNGIEVYYAGFDLNADRFIKKLLKAAPHKDQTLVVSSDREVRDTARRLLVRSLTAAEFVELLQQADESVVTEVRTNAALVKTSQEDNPELDHLLEQATERIPLKKDDMTNKQQSVHIKKMSKHERDLQQLKKKL